MSSKAKFHNSALTALQMCTIYTTLAKSVLLIRIKSTVIAQQFKIHCKQHSFLILLTQRIVVYVNTLYNRCSEYQFNIRTYFYQLLRKQTKRISPLRTFSMVHINVLFLKTTISFLVILAFNLFFFFFFLAMLCSL